jgi:uncharacterized protein
MKPERGTLRLSVGCEADNPEVALRDCTMTVNALRAAIDQLAASNPSPITWFAVLPIRTRSWSPWNKDGKTLPMRFSASAQIKVKFSDFTALAQFANTHGSARYVELEGVDWALTEITKIRVQQQVLTEAVRDAVARATQIANAAGASQVTALEISDPGLLSGIHGTASAAFATSAQTMRGGASDADVPDLVPEDVELTAEVHARFTAG